MGNNVSSLFLHSMFHHLGGGGGGGGGGGARDFPWPLSLRTLHGD